jgi:hypothetical protein
MEDYQSQTIKMAGLAVPATDQGKSFAARHSERREESPANLNQLAEVPTRSLQRSCLRFGNGRMVDYV